MSGATVYAERVGDSIETNATYVDKELARSVPGSRFHTPPPVWSVPLSWAACRQLRGTFGERLRVGPELRKWAEEELENRVKRALALREEALGGPIPIKPPGGLKLRPFQESDVRWMLAASSGLLMNPAGAGKALDVRTQVMTSRGWLQLGEITAGDYVLGSDHTPVEVLAAHSPYVTTDIYSVSLGGSGVREYANFTADGEHLWVVHPIAPGCLPKTLSTRELYLDQTRSDGRHKWKIRRDATPLRFPASTTDLPIDSYLLGLWLGDGLSDRAAICCGDEDKWWLSKLLGTEPRRSKTAWVFPAPILKAGLSMFNLFGSKRVPRLYQYASVEERLSLLQGILDSDGHCSLGNKFEVSFKSEALAQDLLELVRGLGERATLKVGATRATNGKPGNSSIRHRICWTGISVNEPFKLPRKAATFHKTVGRTQLGLVVDVVRLSNSKTTVRCLTVAAPDGVWLVGRELVPTHNTPSTLTWMRNNAIERGLVICPAAMRLPWAEMAGDWYPELEPIPIIGTAAERRRLIEEVREYGGMAIVGLESVRAHSRLAPYGQVKLTESEKQPKDLNHIDWQVVVCDEAHRLADPKSKQTRATWAVGRPAQHRWGLTATPQTKGLDTLWAPLHFVDHVEHPSRTKFIDRYCMTSTNFWGGLTVGALRPEMEEEFQAIFDPRSRRLPKEIVLPQLPDVVRIVRELDMTKEQATAYEQMARLSIAAVEGAQVIVATSTAAQYTRLGQFASSHAHVEVRDVRNRETGELTPKEFVELNEPSNKIDAFMSDLHDWLAAEESVAAFATSRRLIVLLSSILTRKKIKHSLVVGGQKDIDRFEQIKQFQDGEVPVILVVVAAGGAGITLTRARIGAVLQRSWSNVDDQQMEGRWNRIGSEIHESTMRVDYLSKGTVDIGQFYDVLPGKEGMAQVVLRDAETIKRIMRGKRAKETET